MKKLIKLILLTNLFILSACHSEKLNPVSSEQIIVAFGDSLTAGYDLVSEDSYPSQLSQMINRNIINEGVSGNTTEDGLNRFDEMLEKDQPSLILLCLGGNDMLQHKSMLQMKSNIEKMIDIAKSKNIQVLLIAVPTPNPLYLSNNENYKIIAKDEHIPLDDQAFISVEGKNELKVDPLHPNQAGYHVVAEILAQKLKSLGAI